MCEAILMILGVAFVSSGIALTVRIVNRRERWSMWTAAALVMTLAYPMSHGPAWWLFVVLRKPEWMSTVLYYVYIPVWAVTNSCPECVQQSWRSYLNWWLWLAAVSHS
jgi:hypothetical protein